MCEMTDGAKQINPMQTGKHKALLRERAWRAGIGASSLRER